MAAVLTRGQKWSIKVLTALVLLACYHNSIHVSSSASPSTAGLGLPQMPLDATIGQVFAPYCPSRRHGHRFRRKKSSYGIVKLLFEASVQKARNGPSTQVIKATSCVERWNATINAKEHG